jgi:tetratricopeptide (TPR) repeat protein
VNDSRHYDALMQLGNYYAEKKDNRALMFFDKAIAVNEFSDEALYAKGLFLQNKHLYRDAAALYETVAKMNPSHVFCRYNLAYINALFENYRKAIDLLDETIDLAPEYADAYTLRGAMKEKLKNSTGAFNDYSKALQLDKDQKLAREGLNRINITISMP